MHGSVRATQLYVRSVEEDMSQFARLSFTVLALLLFVLPSVAQLSQQPKVLAPHRPIAPKVANPIALPPAVPGSMVGGPWITNANFKSSIYLKNVVETSPVTITPVLYLSMELSTSSLM